MSINKPLPKETFIVYKLIDNPEMIGEWFNRLLTGLGDGVMNLEKLFKIQRRLDEHIEKEHPRQPGEDRLSKKILALQVELGELCNCWRGFKFWSKDQEPITEVPDFETWKKNGHKTYKGKPIMHFKNPLLEEYVDCLHFILSIGLELGMDEIVGELDLKKFNFLTSNTILSCFIGLSYDIADFYYQRENDDMVPYLYGHILLEFAKLGEMLGFTWDQIEQAYIQKNQVNHERQAQNY